MLVLTVAIGLGGLSWVTAGCDRRPAEATAAPKPISEYFPIKVGNQTVRMQVAITEHEKNLGLMNRRDLGADQGMIFIFNDAARRGFWMKNTPTPLDIGYFSSDGVLREIYQMYPFDETSAVSKSHEIQFALEMNQGWYKQHDIKPGAKLDLKALIAAVKARGAEPHQLGLGAHLP
jgi:uncharacterized protein